MQTIESIAYRETSVSFAECDRRGVLFWRYKPGVEVTLTEAQEEIDAFLPLIQEHLGGQSLLLIDIRAMKSITRAARNIFASKHTHEVGGVRGLALVLDSPISVTIGNIYQRINRTLHPTRLFRSEEQALNWLLQLN